MYFKLWLCISLGVVGLGFSCPALCCPSAFTKNKEKKTFVSKEAFEKKIEEEGIYSQRQWIKARKENPELKNRYPSEPEKIYLGFKWPGKKNFVSEEVFEKEIVEEMGIPSQKQWVKARNKNPDLKNRYPAWPETTYSNFKWPRVRISLKKEDMVSKEVFTKKIVEEMGILSQPQWKKVRKENPELKNHYPYQPEKVYPNFKWIGYRIRLKKEDMVSEEVFIKEIVEEMGILSQPQWKKVRKENPELKNHYPYQPEKVYLGFKWPGYQIKIKKETMVSKEVFEKEIVEEMGIPSQKQWIEARNKNPDLKNRYPSSPEKIYPNFKWIGYRIRLKKEDMVSEEVFIKDIVEEMGIPSQEQWAKAREENPELKNRYPYWPEKIYPNFKWSGKKKIVQENHLQENHLMDGFVSMEDFIEHVVDIMGVTSQPEWVQLRIEYPEFQKHYPLWPEKVYKDFLWFVWKKNPANIF